MTHTAIWCTGALFTLGFMRRDPDGFLELLFWAAAWPLFLGREIRERLDK